MNRPKPIALIVLGVGLEAAVGITFAVIERIRNAHS